MIEFRNIAIQNFLSIKEATVDLDSRGLVLIEGVNEDDPSAASNGAGKSSIVDAISWCLYGATAKGVRADSVVNLKAGKDCAVSLSLTVDGKAYIITRYRKHHKHGNKVTLVEADGLVSTHHTAGTDKLTQVRIDSLLGCDADTFNASIYMGQESLVDLPTLTDKALKQVLQSAMGLDRLDRAALLADAAVDNGERVVQIAEREIQNLKEQIDQAQRMQYAAEGTVDKSIATIKAEKLLLDEERASYGDRVADLENRILKLQADLTKADGILQRANDACATYRKDSKLLMELKHSLTAAETARNDAQTAEKLADAELMRLLKAQASGVCHTCNRPHDDATDHSVDIAVAQRKYNEAKDARAMTAKAFDAARTAFHQEHDRLTKEEAKAHEGANKVRAHIAALKATLHADERHLEKYKLEWNDRIHKMEAYIDRLYKAQRDAVEKVRELAALTTALARDLGSKKDGLDAAVIKLGQLERAAHALSRKGFRGEVFDQITPYLNARTQYYLDALTEGNITATWITLQEDSYGNYQEKFHIEVNHKSGVDQFAMLSGGEKRKVRLATALALQDLVATRAFKPIKLFVADEIDDAIDANGLELLMGVLEQKARDVGTVMIISHNPIADMVRNVVTVVKKDGVSTIKAPE